MRRKVSKPTSSYPVYHGPEMPVFEISVNVPRVRMDPVPVRAPAPAPAPAPVMHVEPVSVKEEVVAQTDPVKTKAPRGTRRSVKKRVDASWREYQMHLDYLEGDRMMTQYQADHN